ncbi:hypothetical protein L596_026850 [Steinernema carpocapsae]|uniref:Uncharacterized protein n=1 Tax=Steinernema carpocapsae TaxID=34508 RepID=A0A4U5M2K5_STECR|nr:hypothetical protein L596_026850 [Steinernema carpocapsae]
MFPLNCYLLLGYTGLYMTQLKLGNVVFNVITVLFLNACLGMLLSFKLRWIQIVYPQRYKNAKSHWTWIYGLATQIPISIIFYWLSNRMSVAPPDDSRPMFCFTTDKPTFLLTLTNLEIPVTFFEELSYSGYNLNQFGYASQLDSLGFVLLARQALGNRGSGVTLIYSESWNDPGFGCVNNLQVLSSSGVRFA